MFIKKITVKIKKDKKFIEYIKIIRQYDDSLSMAQIKTAMDNDDVVFCFDPKNNRMIANSFLSSFVEKIRLQFQKERIMEDVALFLPTII